MAAALNHVNVCTIYSVDDSEGVPVIAMEYLVGRPLGRLLEERPLAHDEAIRFAQQIAAGIAAAHARGIVHGDLKPANVFVTDEGVLKLLDFGLSRRDLRSSAPEDTTQLVADSSGSLAGTPCYMSPEQAGGERATPASDVFSFGSMLFELVQGRRAFDGRNVLQVLDRIRNVDPDKLANELSEPFGEIARAPCSVTRAVVTLRCAKLPTS